MAIRRKAGALGAGWLLLVTGFWTFHDPVPADAAGAAGGAAREDQLPEATPLLNLEALDDPIERALPDLSPADLRSVRAERARFEKLNAVWRLKGEGKLEEGLEAAKRLVGLEPGWGPAIDAVVDFAAAGHQVEETARWFEQGRETGHVAWERWYGLAALRAAEEDWERALGAAQEAVAASCSYAGCYSTAATALGKLKRGGEGESYFRGMIASAKEDRELIGLAWLGLGEMLALFPSRYADSLTALQQAVQALRPGRGREWAQFMAGQLSLKTEQGRQQIAYFLDAHALYRELDDRRRVGQTLAALGTCLLGRLRPREAIPVFQCALPILREMGAWQVRNAVTLRIGNAYGNLRDFPTAIGWLELAVEESRKVGDRLGEGRALAEMAENHAVMGERKRSAAEFTLALEALRNAGDLRSVGQVLNKMAVLHVNWGQVRQGITYFEEALVTAERLDHLPSQSMALGNLGTTYQLLGDLERATYYYQRSLAIGQRMKDPGWGGGTLSNLAAIASEMGEYDRAIDLARQAIAIQHAISNEGGEALAYAALADAYMGKGELHQAHDSAEHAVALGRTSSSRDLAGTLRGLGMVCYLLGAFDEALVHLQEALKIQQTRGDRMEEMTTRLDIVQALTARGDSAAALSDAGQAFVFAEAALAELDDLELEAAWFASIAPLAAVRVSLLTSDASEGNTPLPGRHRLEESFAIGEFARSRSFRHRLQKVRLEQQVGAPADAIARLQHANDSLNQARHFLTSATMSPTEREVLRAWLQPRLEPRLALQKQSNGPLTPEDLQLKSWLDAVVRDTLPESDRQTLRHELIAWREREYAQAQQALNDALPREEDQQAPATVSLADLQSDLDDRMVLIAYLLGTDRSFAWVVTRHDSRLLRLPPEKQIGTQVDQLRAALANPEEPLTSIARQASALYALLLAPATDLFPPHARMIIVPDASLGELPFEALVSRPMQDGDTLPAWLGLDHEITYTPSATVWHQTHRRADFPRVDGPMLILADPVYHEDRCRHGRTLVAAQATEHRDALFMQPLPRLCYSGEEARLIRRARGPWSGRDDVVLMGARASESLFRAQALSDFPLIHLSTHAAAWPDAPLRSTIVLSQQKEPVSSPTAGEPGEVDGYLDLREIYRLRLRADLVVLPGCHTAVGRRRKGEGIESLARGFLIAGARQVLASQWAVRDRSTAAFMGRFYRELRHVPASEALYRTHRAFMLGELGRHGRRYHSSDGDLQVWRHPFYWAPFVLIQG